jgi:hypothetical protein
VKVEGKEQKMKREKKKKGEERTKKKKKILKCVTVNLYIRKFTVTKLMKMYYF